MRLAHAHEWHEAIRILAWFAMYLLDVTWQQVVNDVVFRFMSGIFQNEIAIKDSEKIFFPIHTGKDKRRKSLRIDCNQG